MNQIQTLTWMIPSHCFHHSMAGTPSDSINHMLNIAASANIHKCKTKILKVNAVRMEPVKLEGNEIDDVETFTYLVSVIDKHGGTDADVKARIGKARGAFIQLKNIWSSKVLSLHTKIRLFKSNLKSVLLYGAETWVTTNTTTKKLPTFINNCLRRILQIRWPKKKLL